MAATHYGLGLHLQTVNDLDKNPPSNLSNTFKASWRNVDANGSHN